MFNNNKEKQERKQRKCLAISHFYNEKFGINQPIISEEYKETKKSDLTPFKNLQQAHLVLLKFSMQTRTKH